MGSAVFDRSALKCRPVVCAMPAEEVRVLVKSQARKGEGSASENARPFSEVLDVPRRASTGRASLRPHTPQSCPISDPSSRRRLASRSTISMASRSPPGLVGDPNHAAVPHDHLVLEEEGVDDGDGGFGPVTPAHHDGPADLVPQPPPEGPGAVHGGWGQVFILGVSSLQLPAWR